MHEILAACTANESTTRMLIESLAEEAWDAKMPGGKGRTIRSIVAHMHNVRRMWLKSAKHPFIPPEADKESLTRSDANDLLEQSYRAVIAAAEPLLPDGKFPGFGSHATAFLCYLIAHDSHHRGQICMQARLLGYPLPKTVGFGMWEWGKLSRGATA